MDDRTNTRVTLLRGAQPVIVRPAPQHRKPAYFNGIARSDNGWVLLLLAVFDRKLKRTFTELAQQRNEFTVGEHRHERVT